MRVRSGPRRPPWPVDQVAAQAALVVEEARAFGDRAAVAPTTSAVSGAASKFGDQGERAPDDPERADHHDGHDHDRDRPGPPARAPLAPVGEERRARAGARRRRAARGR